jgi:hypothetical protein
MTTRIYEGTNQPGEGSRLQCRPDWADMRATRPRPWISVKPDGQTDSNPHGAVFPFQAADASSGSTAPSRRRVHWLCSMAAQACLPIVHLVHRPFWWRLTSACKS